MVKRILILLAVLASWPALAQVQPPDVPTPVNPVATYKTDGTANTLGALPMPVLAKQLPDIPTPSGLRATWTSTTNAVANVVTDLNNDESKFRTQFNMNFCSYDDPIRNFGQPGASHLHCFFGSTQGGAYSTFATLRNNCINAFLAGKSGSTAPGGPLNCTLYWISPLVDTNPNGDGKNYILNPYFIVGYYVNTPAALKTVKQRLPRGKRYVFAVNMDDPDNCGLKNEINLANGGSGTGCINPTSGRYRLSSFGHYPADGNLGNGFAGWSCYNGDALANGPSEPVGGSGTVYENPSLVNADGSDPFPTCTGPGTLAAIVDAPPCTNGKDLWTPGGYSGERQRVRDTLMNTDICPQGWYEQPQIQLKFYFRFETVAQRKRIRLSADDMCATVAGHPMPNGSCFHTDWLGGWDDDVFQQWQVDGTGVGNPSTVYSLNGSTFKGSPATRLVGGITGEPAPDGTRNQQTSTSWVAVTSQIPANKGKGPATINAKPNQ